MSDADPDRELSDWTPPPVPASRRIERRPRTRNHPMQRHRPASLAATLILTLTCALPAGQRATADTLLVVRKSADALDLIDPGSGLRLASVGVGFAPHEVSVSPDGKRAVVSNYGTREKPGSSVSIVDLEQPRELRRIDLAPHTRPHGVDWYRPDRVAVTTEGSRHLLVIEPATGEIVGSSLTGQDVSHMVAVKPDERGAFVANIGSGSLTAVPLGNHRTDAPFTVATGPGTEGIAVHPNGRQVWVLARAEGTLSWFDAHTLERLGGTDMPGIPIRIAFSPDGARAYVTRAGASDVVALDGITGQQFARRKLDVPLAPDAASRPFAKLAPGSSLPVGLAVAPDGRSIFVAATMADRVLQLDALTLEVMRTIEVGGEPDGLALTPVMPKAVCHACAAPEAARE
jgi:YVTN family beta-propeller protein